MTLKLSAGFVLLLIALTLQFSLASANIYFNLSFAALIAFAFVFGFWELVLLVLVAVFIVNWQPAASVEILVFALFPLAVYFLRNALRSRMWFGNLLAILLGFLVLSLATAPAMFLSSLRIFLLDLGAGWLFGTCVLLLLYRWGRE